MALLIDTMNVLHAWSGLRTGQADPSVAGLARLIASSRYASRRVRMVCDGRAPADWSDRIELPLDATARVTAIYAGRGRDADSLIERLLDEDPGVRHTLVVSADRRLIKAARRRKAASLSSVAFLHQLLADARDAGIPTPDPASRVRSAIPLAASTVEGWLRFFKINDPTGTSSRAAQTTTPRNAGPSHPRPIERLVAEQRPAASRSAPQGPAAQRPRSTPKPAAPDRVADDPALERLIREAIADGTRIDPADLDMSKWLD